MGTNGLKAPEAPKEYETEREHVLAQGFELVLATTLCVREMLVAALGLKGKAAVALVEGAVRLLDQMRSRGMTWQVAAPARVRLDGGPVGGCPPTGCVE